MSEKTSVQTERGFITRCFYERGNTSLVQSYATAVAAGVRDDWFEDPTSRVVWKAANSLFESGDLSGVSLSALVGAAVKVARASKDSDEKSVRLKLEFFTDSQKYVRRDDDLASYCSLLLDAYIVRKTKDAVADTMERMASGGGAAAALAHLIGKAQGILSLSNSRHELSLSEIGDKVVSEYETAYREIVEKGNYEYTPGIKMPWRKLSYALNGFDSDVYIIAARPGVGKTSFALNFSRYWTDAGYRVVFNSVDMSPKGFVKRILAEKTRISSRQMQFAKSSDFKADIAKIKAELESVKELERTGRFKALKDYDIDSLRASVSILKDQGLIDVLIVDYLQLMTCRDAARMGDTAKVSYISNRLHEMAVDLGIPILCLSQLNRDSAKDGGRDPQLTDLRGSGSIEQDAAAVLLLYRDEALLKKWRDSEPPVQFARNRQPSPGLKSYCPVWCLIAKNREGDCGVKLPFVVVQNKYAWYLADYEQKGAEAFNRVYDDWRHDSIESVWEANGSLIRMEDVRQIEIKNLNIRRQEKGLPPIVQGVRAADGAADCAAAGADARREEADNPQDPYVRPAEPADDGTYPWEF